MLLTAIVIATTLLPRVEPGIEALRRRAGDAAGMLALPGPAPEPPSRFMADARAVSNWRAEAGGALRPLSLAMVARHAPNPPAFVARCVKLNNYWCIKSARWNGEIGADAEGHTGFADAASGADAAAQLLRRYYRDLGRQSALAIVRRWAPAECRSPSASRGPSAAAAGVSPDIAPLGLRKTVRARFLARNAPGGGPKRASGGTPGLRVQPWSARALMARAGRAAPPPRIQVASRTPEAVSDGAPPRPTPGLLVRPSVIVARPSVLLVRPSEILVKPSPVTGRPAAAVQSRPRPAARAATSLADRLAAESAALPVIAAGLPGIPLLDLRVPAPLCSNDETRIRNYAGRIAASVGVKPDDDLRLFDGDGRPTPNLAPVMLAMSAVELGTLKAGPDLVAAAIARLSQRLADATPAAGP
ncbi:hypothetical protein [Methylobacterium sp. Leaf108]|uniref:hypothetical protein n=1 Tax=Methylobacterium sp. Leaf108 TaxID=1736256 RepID=UPI0007007EBF|nr:hypothetical protein [Methylobacterium sp. Leaf108]KQP58095.1 hypothetical protein ASF39_18785 [Methylobacterium sp. Leaf108]